MNNTLSFLVGMIVGAVVGGVAALFLTPQSGAELRASIQEQANQERQRLQNRYEQQLGQMQAQLDNVNEDVQSMLEQAKKTGHSESAAPQSNE